ncbi:MAG: tol-pal system protein YbgF [Sneathiella sp.]|nr:tol-pal system protein YbgF [Sneathiella sp.]
MQAITKFAFVSACLIPIVATPLSNASAQSSEVQALLDRINRLEADLNNVQRKVFQGQNVPAPKFNSGSGSVAGGSEAAALLSSRLDTLEEEQRSATGSTEEITFKVDQISSRLNKLVLDVDFRLTEIEQRLKGNVPLNEGLVGTPTDNRSSLAGVPNNGQLATSPAGSTSQGNSLPTGTRLLGTIRVPEGAQNSGQQAVGNIANVQESATIQVNPEDQYNRAISLIRTDDYAGAEQAFSSFLENNKDHTLSGNAQYWLGETHYVRGDYPNAASAFLKGYQEYPNSSKAADNLLKLAMTLGRMDQRQEACVTFQQMDKQFSKLPSRLKRISNSEKKKFECR